MDIGENISGDRPTGPQDPLNHHFAQLIYLGRFSVESGMPFTGQEHVVEALKLLEDSETIYFSTDSQQETVGLLRIIDGNTPDSSQLDRLRDLLEAINEQRRSKV